jgi:predicted DNA-binding transcriptional regulator AlpA
MPTPLSVLHSLVLSSTAPGAITQASQTLSGKVVTSAEHAIEPLISEKQLQDILGVGFQTLKRWRQAGTGPRYIALGTRRLAYRPSDVKAWLESRQRASGRLYSIDHEKELEHFTA